MEIIITPVTNRPGIYQAHYDETLLCTSRLPFFDGARLLLSQGYPADTALSLRHSRKDFVSLRSTIGEAAKLTVIENERVGPRITKFRPNTFITSEGKQKESQHLVPAS